MQKGSFLFWTCFCLSRFSNFGAVAVEAVTTHGEACVSGRGQARLAWDQMAVHSPVNGTTAIPWRSSQKKLSLLERLRGCEEAWCPKEPWTREEARAAIRGTPAGSFLVLRDSVTSEPSLLCVSTPDQHEPVSERDVLRTGKIFQLSGSRLSFSDITQLVLFYSFTRDVLPVSLCLPHWVYSVTDSKDFPSQLEPRMWLNEQQPEEKTNKGPNTVMCSIQVQYSGL